MSFGTIGSCARLLSVSVAFIAAPLAPVLLLIPFEFIISRSIEHLNPMMLICIIFGYIAMVFFALPLYLLNGQTVPECSLLVKLGATVGALIPMVICISLVFVVSLDDTWWNDVQDMIAFLVGGTLSGAVSGAAFWFFAYSWRTEPSKSTTK